MLREEGLATSRVDAQHRIYRLEPEALDEVADTVESYRRLWNQRLDVLDTEIARDRREDVRP